MLYVGSEITSDISTHPPVKRGFRKVSSVNMLP